MLRSIRVALAAALLSAVALPAIAAEMPAAAADTHAQASTQNNAQAGTSDVGANPAPNMQIAANMPSSTGMGISSDPSPTQRKATHTASQRAKADAAEAETTRQLNQQAAELAKPDSAIR